MKIILKKFIKSQFTQKLLARIAYLYLNFVYQTTRWKIVGQDILEELYKNNIPTLTCFWHGRLAMMPFAWQRNRPFYMLLSEHSDGKMIAAVLELFGIHSIYGSSTRGGARAALECVRILKKGITIGITPDGPKGPLESVADGVLHLARLSGGAIVPTTFSIKRKKKLKTWDKFLFPLPFSSGVILIGNPVEINFEEDVGSQKLMIQKALRNLNQQADAMVL